MLIFDKQTSMYEGEYLEHRRNLHSSINIKEIERKLSNLWLQSFIQEKLIVCLPHITVTHSDSEVLAHTIVMWCMTSAV